LAARRPADVDTAAGVGADFEVDAVGAIAVVGTVYGSNAIADALAARIVVLGLDGTGNCGRRAAVRAFGRR